MTSKTSILLIVSQHPGIDYQALLSKIAPNYANLNSARAALSRVLKDAVSFGMVSKQGHQLFLTDKGSAGLKVKMHDKLILKLNQLMKIRNVSNNPDALIQHLSVLLERGKLDPRLLDNARASVSFTLDDLVMVHRGLQENIRHLSYLEKTLDLQEQSLRELNFPSAHIKKTNEMVPHIPKLIQLSAAEEIQLENPKMDLSQNVFNPLTAGMPAVTKGNRVALPAQHLQEIVIRLPNQEPTFTNVKAYLGLFTLDLGRETVLVRGPSQLLEKLFPRPEKMDEIVSTKTEKSKETNKQAQHHPQPLLPAEPLEPLPFFPYPPEGNPPPASPGEEPDSEE